MRNKLNKLLIKVIEYLKKVDKPYKLNIWLFRRCCDILYKTIKFKKIGHLIKINDYVKLNFNPCNPHCGCYWNKDKEPLLKPNTLYKVKKINYFGGGCPPKLLILEGINDKSNKLLDGYPANWFIKTIKT